MLQIARLTCVSLHRSDFVSKERQQLADGLCAGQFGVAETAGHWQQPRTYQPHALPCSPGHDHFNYSPILSRPPILQDCERTEWVTARRGTGEHSGALAGSCIKHFSFPQSADSLKTRDPQKLWAGPGIIWESSRAAPESGVQTFQGCLSNPCGADAQATGMSRASPLWQRLAAKTPKQTRMVICHWTHCKAARCTCGPAQTTKACLWANLRAHLALRLILRRPPALGLSMAWTSCCRRLPSQGLLSSWCLYGWIYCALILHACVLEFFSCSLENFSCL